ncbi:MAG: hypothetical protein ACREUU_01865 [Gammaproteobacteria bacterium]
MRIDEKRLDSADTGGPPIAAEVALASGSRLRVAAVMLYEKASVERALDLRVSAFSILNADPASLPALEEWAITPALLVGAVNRGVSAKKADEAEDLLRESETLAAEARAAGRFFEVAKISGLESPHPHHWSCAETLVVLQRKGILGREVEEETEQVWIHSGEAFVTVQDDNGDRHDLRWTHVEQYRLLYADDQ